MQSIRRSCQSALHTSRSPCITSNGARRAFSRSSACRRGNLPQFLEPSSPELSTLLSQLNSKVLLPEHLNKEQQDLVYKQENRARLEAEPITITLGNITLPLEHINRNRDQPSRWNTIREVVKKSETAEDWENVLRMMEGFTDASVHLRPQWHEMIVRRMNQAGQQHLVLKALQRADKTGLKLVTEGVVTTVFKGLHDKAAASGWEKAETEKALSFAEQIVELMEGKEHIGRQRQNSQVDDYRTSPLVICVPAGLAAVRAKKHTEGQDKDDKVKKYAGRLMNAVNQNNFNAIQLPAELERLSISPDVKTKHDISVAVGVLKRDLHRLVTLWGALKTSNEVLGADMPMAETAKKMEIDIKDGLERGIDVLKDVKKRGFGGNVEGVENRVTKYAEI